METIGVIHIPTQNIQVSHCIWILYIQTEMKEHKQEKIS